MIARILSAAVFALFLSSCATYQTMQVDGKTPIYCFEQGQMEKVSQVMGKTLGEFAKGMQSAKDDKGPRVTVEWNIHITGASGKGADGVLADGHVAREKLKIQGGKNSPKRKESEDLVNWLRADFLKGLDAIKKPVYVERYKLD